MKKGFTLAEGATHVGMFDKKRKFGFTLAEVLITLGIIGVVAALTIPTLMSNYKSRAYSTASDVFQKKFTEAIKTMNVEGGLGKYGKYNTTEGFVEELQKHFKIANVCDKDHTMQCFGKTVTWGEQDVDLSTIKEAKDFVEVAEGEADWGTNVMGLQFANGVTGLIAYNPKCKSDPHNNQVTGSDCYAMVYDTSGFSDPNELGKDLIATANVKNLAEGRCVAEINGICITKLAFNPTPITKAECNAIKGDLDIDACYHENDYWAGAVKTCRGISKMPTMEQLAEIANYIYDTEGIPSKNNMSNLTRIDSRVTSSFGFNIESGVEFRVWSGEERNNLNAYNMNYRGTMTSVDFFYQRKESSILAICVK